MVDKIIKELNQQIAKKISNQAPVGQPQGGGEVLSKFDQILNTKQENLSFEKLSANIETNKVSNNNQMEVLSAQDIQINVPEKEFSNLSTFDGKKTISDLFSTINNDALKMDSIIEVLSSNDANLSRRQLLAYQASIGSLTINTELFSKLAQSISQNINTLLQTNMG